MAVIKIYVEGGVLEHSNVNVQTINNSERLRESFYRLFSQIVEPEKFRLEIELGSGIRQTVNFFKAQLSKEIDAYLLIDLDMPKHRKRERLREFELEDAITVERVFFMVQEMEAWILSQPNKIEECYRYLKRVKQNIRLEEDSTINSKDPEEIIKPSEKLHTLLGRYFRVEKKGKERKKKYKKLSDGADLLELLDMKLLQTTFEDVEKLLRTIKV